MCRFTLYLGSPIRLSSLLFEPEHSLMRQSTRKQERAGPLNGDGFGVGWYARALCPEPAVFRSVTPAWNNRNLRSLSRVVVSDCILAHVRSATERSRVDEANCHPFRYGPFLFMHNGDIGSFGRVRRKLLNEISDDAFSNVHGSTDSELCFAALIDEWLPLDDTPPLERLAASMERAIARVTSIAARHGDNAPCHLNCAVSDGNRAVVSRFANAPNEGPPSLYYYSGQPFASASADPNAEPDAGSILVSSERSTATVGWEVIPPNHMILLDRERAMPELRSLAHLAKLPVPPARGRRAT
jgi:glutamine amidotransferase